jgi:hypothetical protein
MPKGICSDDLVQEYAKVQLAIEDMVVSSGGAGGFIHMSDPGRVLLMSGFKG